MEINVAPADVVNVTVSVTALRQTACSSTERSQIRIVYAYGSDPSKIDHIRKMLSPSDAVEFMGNITDKKPTAVRHQRIRDLFKLAQLLERPLRNERSTCWKIQVQCHEPCLPQCERVRSVENSEDPACGVNLKPFATYNIVDSWRAIHLNVTMSEPVYTGAFAHHNATPDTTCPSEIQSQKI